jgi:hypothetical protein
MVKSTKPTWKKLIQEEVHKIFENYFGADRREPTYRQTVEMHNKALEMVQQLQQEGYYDSQVLKIAYMMENSVRNAMIKNNKVIPDMPMAHADDD